jgi:alkylated DNA repair dioxygenase AlkB
MGNDSWYLDYYSIEDPDTLFSSCQKLKMIEKPAIDGTGNHARRDMNVFSDEAKGYQPSKQSAWNVPAQPLPEFLQSLLQEINGFFSETFNMVLVNKYLTQDDMIGPHFDQPAGNGAHCVVTISLGATRGYSVISRETGQIVQTIEMKHGDVLVMSNTFQLLYMHAVFPSKTPCGTRISLTTRCVKPSKPPIVHSRGQPQEPHPCLRCGVETKAKSKVCATCYNMNAFSCPECQQPAGAPWLCQSCWVTKKQA